MVLVVICVAIAAPIVYYGSDIPESEPPLNVMLKLSYDKSTSKLKISHLSGAYIENALTSSGGGSSGGGLLYSEDFESDMGGWTISGRDYEWERGNNFLGDTLSCCYGGCPDCTEPNSAYSGSYALGTNIGGCHPNGPTTGEEWGYVSSPVIDLSAASGQLTLTYWIAYQLEGSCCDTGKVQIDDNSGFSNPTNILSFTSSSGCNAAGCDYHDWQEYTYDITSYSGGNLYMRVGMEADGGWEWTGVYLDYIQIEDAGGGGGDGSVDYNDLIVKVSGCSPTDYTITGSQDFYPGEEITVQYSGIDSDATGITFSVIYKPGEQLLKTLSI